MPASDTAPIGLLGCDFSSRPSRRKPIVLAWGRRSGDRVALTALEPIAALPDFATRLAGPQRWIGGFDFPFGLPRELVEQLGWPREWMACIRHYAALERSAIRAQFAAFCAARPVGGKFAHRATDRPAGSSPSMKWVNPPVAYMLHAGVPALLAAGAHLPGLCEGDRTRVALEAYPGLLARELLGRRSYKSDDPARQNAERAAARAELLQGLERGATRLALTLVVDAAQRRVLLADASGDALDATLCLLQAAWAERAHAQGAPCYGLPAAFDPLEGWIVTA